MTAKTTTATMSSIHQTCEITLAEGWVRYDVTVDVPDNWSSCTLKAELSVEQAEGIALFDAVQLEPGDSANDYNLLENGRFDHIDSYMPENWIGENLSPADGAQDGLMLIMGEDDLDKRLYQTVRVDAKAGQTLVFNAFALASAKSGEDSRFGMVLDAGMDSENNDRIAYAPFSATVYELFQMAGGALRLEEDCEYVTLSLVYYNQINYAAFGGAALYVGNFGETFEYNEIGLLESVKNDFGSSISIAYDGMDPITIQQKYGEDELKKIEIAYDDYHNVIQTEVAGITTDYYYGGTQDGSTTYGVITEIVSTADELLTGEMMTYTPDYNYLASYTDSRLMTSTFDYDVLSGQLLSATDANGNTVEYTYDGATGELLAVSGQAEPNVPVVTAFSFADGLLDEITRGGTAYGLEYDEIGRYYGASIGGAVLVSNDYDARQRLSLQNYANGDSYAPEYDYKNRVISETYDNANTPNFSYSYNLKNQMNRLVDRENGTTWNYGYDVSGRLANFWGSDGTQARFDFNSKADKLSRLTVSQNGDTISDVEYFYADDGRPIEATLYSMEDSSVNYGFDGLNRLEQTELWMGEAGVLQHGYSYLTGSYEDMDVATGLVGQLLQEFDDGEGAEPLGEYTYIYDDAGNITSVTDIDGNVTQYSYDGLNRLVREDNQVLDVTTTFSYDTEGNLLAKTTYEYTVGALGLALDTVSYAYGNANWADQLTSYDGKAITYDAMGNPLTYDGYSYSWQKGRQLAGISGNGLTASYKYNSEGLRTEKTIDSVTTKFTWVGGLLMRQSDGTGTLDFAYDASGRAIGFKYGGGLYFYLYNLQGDVMGIVDAEGDIVAAYTYDAYGNVLAADGVLAEMNPLRYRGYYWDSEIGVYYLQSRYYNPQWGRFLNADSLLIAGNVLTGSNMYAYCNGNPVMLADPDGQCPWKRNCNCWQEWLKGNVVEPIKEAVVEHIVEPIVNFVEAVVETMIAVVETVTNVITGTPESKPTSTPVSAPTSKPTGVLPVEQKPTPQVPDTIVTGQAQVELQLQDQLQSQEIMAASLLDTLKSIWSFVSPILLWFAPLVLLLFQFDPNFSVTWTWKVDLNNLANETAVQGLAMDTTYCYSFEVKGTSNAEETHYLYRKDMTSDSIPENMSDSNGQTDPALLHANDAAVAIYTDSSGVTHRYIYVVAWSNVAGKTNYLVKLKYTGNTYQEVARYTYNAATDKNDNKINISEYGGISLIRYWNDANVQYAQFLLKSTAVPSEICRISVRLDQTTASNAPVALNPTYLFKIERPTAYKNYTNQGVEYNGGKLYVPLWGYKKDSSGKVLVNKPNENVILVYNNVETAIANRPDSALKAGNASNPWTIKGGGTDKNRKFEIEGIEFDSNDVLWFNTNEAEDINKPGTKLNGGIYTNPKK